MLFADAVPSSGGVGGSSVFSLVQAASRKLAAMLDSLYFMFMILFFVIYSLLFLQRNRFITSAGNRIRYSDCYIICSICIYSRCCRNRNFCRTIFRYNRRRIRNADPSTADIRDSNNGTFITFDFYFDCSV